jgi:hypothetical protein
MVLAILDTIKAVAQLLIVPILSFSLKFYQLGKGNQSLNLSRVPKSVFTDRYGLFKTLLIQIRR